MNRIVTRDDEKGEILVTKVKSSPANYHERWHLARMDSGEWAILDSWIRTSPWLGDVRVYDVHNRLGSHATLEEVLARWDLHDPAEAVPFGMPES